MRLLFALFLLLTAAALFAPDVHAEPVRQGGFNHDTTGYPLTGAHEHAKCETCHLRGVFRGTPRDCASCHAPSSRVASVVMPANHIPVTERCDNCHTTTTFYGARFNHYNVVPGTCNQCHNGSTPAPAKPAGHIVTTASCDSCHRVMAFLPATFSHTNVAAGTCQQCHNGTTAKGKSSTHLITSSSCDACHTTTAWIPGVRFDHAGVLPGTCKQCHDGVHAPGQKPGHVPTPASCDACHTTQSFLPALVDHTAVVAGTCAQCHDGKSATGKPANHIPTTSSCDSCHKTQAWTPTTFSHQGVAAGTCAQCHNGTQATGKPMGHIATSSSCDTCHTTAGWLPVTFSHKGIQAGTCGNCHNGTQAMGKVATHIPVSGPACDACHRNINFVSWANTAMNHGAVQGIACNTCHEAGTSFFGGTVVMRPSTQSDPAHPQTGDCGACHTTTSFGTVTSKPPGHIPTTQACTLCHTTPGVFAGGVMNHQGITGNCAQCHAAGLTFTGVTVKSPPSTHLPVNGVACEGCHSVNNFVTFSGTAINHAAVAGIACATCHETGKSWFGVTIVTRPTPQADPNHPATGDCASCHNTASFAGANAKPANHLPTTQACSLCHTPPGVFTNGKMNHQGITGGCVSCHAGGLTFAVNMSPVGPPANHIPVKGVPCESCHSPTVFTSFAGTTMNHSGVASIACATCHETGKTWFGVAIVTRPTPSADPNHPATGDCASCHNTTSFKTATSKPANHLPTTQPCALCHTTPGVYTNGQMSHQGIASNCAQCHGPGLSFAVNMVPKEAPATHIPTNAAPCESCHSTTNFATFAGTAINHAAVSGMTCATCHESGKTWFGVAIVTRPTPASDPAHPPTGDCTACHNTTTFKTTTKPANHIPTTQPCTLCHTGSDYSKAAMNHQGITGNCAQCHGPGLSFANVVPREPPANHVPYAGKACETCHSSTNFTTFAGTAMNHAGITTGCASCHATGSSYFGVTMKTPPATHIPYTGVACEACHTPNNYTTFSGTKMNHAAVVSFRCADCHELGMSWFGVNVQTRPDRNHNAGHDCGEAGCHKSSDRSFSKALRVGGPGASTPGGPPSPAALAELHGRVLPGRCLTCHDGSHATARPARHLQTALSCDSCHRTTAWIPATYRHADAMPGACLTCHNGVGAKARPANHPVTTQSCDTCHRTTAWLPTLPGSPAASPSPAPRPLAIPKPTQPVPPRGPGNNPR